MGSSRSTRNTLRATAGSEIVGSSVGAFFPASAIPIKFTQALGAFGMFFLETNTSVRDRGLLLFQSVLATTQLVLASILYFEHTTCDSTSTNTMCVASFYLMLVYHGTLLTGWGLSEVLRQPVCSVNESNSGGISGDESVQSMVQIPHHSMMLHTSTLVGDTAHAPMRNSVPGAQHARIMSPTPMNDDTHEPSVHINGPMAG